MSLNDLFESEIFPYTYNLPVLIRYYSKLSFENLASAQYNRNIDISYHRILLTLLYLKT
jgi:hypothetical protein